MEVEHMPIEIAQSKLTQPPLGICDRLENMCATLLKVFVCGVDILCEHPEGTGVNIAFGFAEKDRTWAV